MKTLFGRKVLPFALTLCLGVWYSGVEDVRCRRDDGVSCQVTRTHWLDTTASAPRQIRNVTAVQARPHWGEMGIAGEIYFLESRTERLQLELLDLEDIEKLQTFLNDSTDRRLWVMQNTVGLKLIPIIVVFVLILGSGIGTYGLLCWVGSRG